MLHTRSDVLVFPLFRNIYFWFSHKRLILGLSMDRTGKINSLTHSLESPTASEREQGGGVSVDPSRNTQTGETCLTEIQTKRHLHKLNRKQGLNGCHAETERCLGEGLPSEISLCRRAACQLAGCWEVLCDSLPLHSGTQRWGAHAHQSLESPSLPSSP